MPNAEDTARDVDPEDFLRALLKISPEDAAKVREDAAKRTPPDKRREGEDDRPS